MTTHILVLYPVLAFCGALIAWPLRDGSSWFLKLFNRGGVTGLLVASFALAFWMIPTWVDASLSEPQLNWAKVFSLTFLVGSTLTVSWSSLNWILRALVKIEFLTMLLRLGWIYLIYPDRLCNNYLIDDQVLLGKGFLFMAILISINWIVPLFLDTRPKLRYRVI